MRNIKVRDISKFKDIMYEYVDYGVFYNNQTKKYHFAFEYKVDDNEDTEYPLVFFVEKYGLEVSKDYDGAEIVENDEVIAIVEVMTKTDSKVDLIRILNFSTIIGKQVSFVEYEEYLLLGLIYGIGKVFFDDKYRYSEVPVLSPRTNEYGEDNFEYRDGELDTFKLLEDGVTIDFSVASDMNLQYVLLESDKANFVFYDDREYKVYHCEIKDLNAN